MDHLRVNVKELIPTESPYQYTGSVESWDEEEVRASFANAKPLEIGSVDHLRSPGTILALPMGMPNSFGGSLGALQEIPPSTGDVWALKVTMVGILNRKDDVLEGGRKASSRKWKPWSVLLTGSQLLLFRDPAWAIVLVSQENEHESLPPMALPSVFKPDEIWSVKDAIAVYDTSYTKVCCLFDLFSLRPNLIYESHSSTTMLYDLSSLMPVKSSYKLLMEIS
jgi:hypothetical protein